MQVASIFFGILDFLVFYSHDRGVVAEAELDAVHLSDEDGVGGDEEGGPVHVHRGADGQDEPGGEWAGIGGRMVDWRQAFR